MSKESVNSFHAGGWRYENIACYVCTQQIPGTVPLLRYYKNQTDNHAYTIDPAEGNNWVRNGYVPEGPPGYVYVQQIPDSVPLLRYYQQREQHHFYTTDPNEGNYAVQHLGYVAEGNTGFVFKHPPV